MRRMLTALLLAIVVSIVAVSAVAEPPTDAEARTTCVKLTVLYVWTHPDFHGIILCLPGHVTPIIVPGFVKFA